MIMTKTSYLVQITSRTIRNPEHLEQSFVMRVPGALVSKVVKEQFQTT